ncbi:TIR domain-containing protein [Sorangium sp. So ce119]|uniref:metallophosphoesterase n=1 Tax=Sorangium sp. So ce119 TaxID=3133279 RepID=UPI003F620E4D
MQLIAPVKVFLSYAYEDEVFAGELAAHLLPLAKHGEISLWHDRMVLMGEHVEELHKQHLAAAQMIILLVSADYFASERTAEDCDVALQRRHAESVQVVPILVRPCLWDYTPLGKLQFFPRNVVPVAQWTNRDEAWSEIAKEIQILLRFAASRIEPQRGAGAPEQLRYIGDIFQAFGQPDITFVEPAQLPRLRAYLQVMGQGLVVEGPSGVGKTTVVKRTLRDLKVREQEWLLGQRESDRQKLDELLSAGFRGHLIIDDFHRLDRARQERVADEMKIIADSDDRKSKITVIGINPIGDSLVRALSDLAGRFESIAMSRQPDEKVSELIQKGEHAANIVFRRREEFVAAAAGSFFTAQQLCYEAAFKANIDMTAPRLTHVDVGFRDVVDVVIKNLDSRYFSDLRSFACHDETTPPRGATLALLWLLGQSSDGHVTLEDIRYRFADPDVRSALDRLKSGYLAQLFEQIPDLKSLFFYNQNAGVLSLEDPRLVFYLRHMPWPSFITKTGHQDASIDAKGELVFSRKRKSLQYRQHAEQNAACILHLSDLHFSQLSQADIWYGQLADDLQELGCDHIDALVLSGDLTQRADSVEFDAVRRFLLNISTEMRLSPGQVVIVPGNHDVSWPRSKAAYKLQRRESLDAPPEVGKFIAHGAEVLEVRDESAYKRRFEPFAEFYGHVKGVPYSLDYEAQIDVQDFPGLGLLVVGFNSAWETDHFYGSRVSIHSGALNHALVRIRRSSEYAGRLKIAVWHHPFSSPDEDRIKDSGFVERLAQAGFRLVLHGHIHKADRGLFRYDMTQEGRRLDFVAAGTFGAPTRDWVPGIPLQYNLLRISKEKVVVETRRREQLNGAWQPDARWLQGPGKDPLPRYEINLSGEHATE